MSVVMGVSLLTPSLSAFAAAPAAGTVIGNQASATYVDGSGVSRNTTSNLVQTTVAQVKSFTLTADGARTAAPGQTVYFPHVLTNNGNGVDTYALSAPVTGGSFAHTGLAYYVDADGNGVPDNSTPLTSSGPVAAGAQFRFVVAGVIPAVVALGQSGTITVGASDTGGNSATNLDTTTVAASAVSVTKSLSQSTGPSPSPTPVTVTLAYTNAGTAAASDLTIGDVLPSGMTYVPGSARWSTSGATVLSDAGTGNPSGITFDYGVTTPGKLTAVIASVGAGVSGNLTFQVNIIAGLAPNSSAQTTNVATFSTSTQGQSSTNGAAYTVAQTAAVVFNGSATLNTNGTGEPLSVPSAAQGQVVAYTTHVWNNGNGTDSFDVSVLTPNTFPAGTVFQLYKADGTTPLLDTNSNGTPDTGPLLAGERLVVVVKAALPANAAPGNNGGAGYSATLTATSTVAPAQSDTITVNLGSILANSVDLTSTAPSVNVTPASSTPVTTTFPVLVSNTGGSADSFNLSSPTTLPAGWSLTLVADGGNGDCSTTGAALSNSGTIAAGASKLVCAVVTVPSISAGGAPGPVSFDVVAQSPVTLSSTDTQSLTVNVQAVYALTLSPNGAQQTYAGSSVTYVHVLTNIGNTTETATFNAGFLSNSQVAAGWTSSAYLDSNSNVTLDVGTDVLLANGATVVLAPGQSRTIFVRVFAPASASAASPADVATLTATYSVGNVSAVDTTTVTEGLLLSKEQTAVSCAAAGPHAGYSSAAIPAGPNTAPGQCVAYRITATNTTAGAINTVQLSDTVPANTTLHTACGAPAATNGASVGGTATNGTGGTVTASLPSLTSGASFQTTFCVRINP